MFINDMKINFKNTFSWTYSIGLTYYLIFKQLIIFIDFNARIWSQNIDKILYYNCFYLL